MELIRIILTIILIIGFLLMVRRFIKDIFEMHKEDSIIKEMMKKEKDNFN